MKNKNKVTQRQSIGITICLALPIVMLWAGCNQKSDSSMSTSDANGTTNAAMAPADDTAKNVRDRNNATLTPEDQGTSEADREITRKIRHALVSGTNNVTGTNDFSMTAKNVKIITVDGKVTLRGPVNTPEEKTGIELIARNIAGAPNVNDQLEVKTSQ